MANECLKAERIPNGSMMTTLIRVDNLVFFGLRMWSVPTIQHSQEGMMRDAH
ncbi:hypothetical protein [Acidiferrobacter sp. SPIII_3]|uniref:hypothetical protein n=1 Tax=Acidiferrobacter sp. SPIII_3 TaxID=1281578 RepID=UPI00143D911E|nr:hypothetical protein [Acidiferrobacter sp. SPIII_3]